MGGKLKALALFESVREPEFATTKQLKATVLANLHLFTPKQQKTVQDAVNSCKNKKEQKERGRARSRSQSGRRSSSESSKGNGRRKKSRSRSRKKVRRKKEDKEDATKDQDNK